MTSESLEFWTSGRKGNLSRKSQAQVWALTHVSELRGLQLTQGETHGGYNNQRGAQPPSMGNLKFCCEIHGEHRFGNHFLEARFGARLASRAPN